MGEYEKTSKLRMMCKGLGMRTVMVLTRRLLTAKRRTRTTSFLRLYDLLDILLLMPLALLLPMRGGLLDICLVETTFGNKRKVYE